MKAFYFFDGAAPGMVEACELSRVEAEILVSRDGDSVVDDVYNGPLF